MPKNPNDGCLSRTEGQLKTASGINVFLLEELGDARLRHAQLKKYLDDARQLIEKSGKRDHFFETAGHLLHGIPECLAKLGSALNAAALAASRLDYEETKDNLRPEKIEELERALEDVRIRRPQRRGLEEAMNTKSAADLLERLASEVEATGGLHADSVLDLVGELEGQTKLASGPTPEKLAEHLRALGARVLKMAEEGKPPSRLKLASYLRRLVAESMQPTAAQLAAEIFQQSNSREDVMEGFKESNPSMSQEELEKAADMWEQHKNVVKDKTASFGPIRLRTRPHGSGMDPKELVAALNQTAENLYTARGESRSVQQALQDATEGWVARIGPFVGFDDSEIQDAKELKTALYDLDGDSGDAARRAERLARDLKKVSARSHSERRDLSAAEDYGLSAMDEVARHEEGKSVDPTEGMSPEDAKKWREMNDKHEDKFKSADMPDPVADQAMRSRFEEGEPANPTENMDPEDATKWKSMKDEHGDKFKDKSAISVPDKHQLRILQDTVKNPMKGKLLGGPSAEEAEETLRKKFKFTDAQIRRLKRSSDWKAA